MNMSSIKELKREYDKTFVPDEDYLNSMPDLQNQPVASLPIERVGIHNFHLPLKVHQLDGEYQEVRAEISGMVSLDADKAGINMSRIIRTAYGTFGDVFTIDTLCDVLKNYKKDLNSLEAQVMVRFPYRMWTKALRTPNEGGWQYYDITFDLTLNRDGEFRKVMMIDFVYSSACPCSTELSMHAADVRGVYGIPHSQRSVARVMLEFDKMIWIEDVVTLLREVLQTETLVFCKRADEQAFAELNGANVKFVEDAARLIADQLNGEDLVNDYKLIINHLESLHSHNAVAVITKGLPGSKFDPNVTIDEFNSLVR